MSFKNPDKLKKKQTLEKGALHPKKSPKQSQNKKPKTSEIK